MPSIHSQQKYLLADRPPSPTMTLHTEAFHHIVLCTDTVLISVAVYNSNINFNTNCTQ